MYIKSAYYKGEIAITKNFLKEGFRKIENNLIENQVIIPRASKSIMIEYLPNEVLNYIAYRFIEIPCYLAFKITSKHCYLALNANFSLLLKLTTFNTTLPLSIASPLYILHRIAYTDSTTPTITNFTAKTRISDLINFPLEIAISNLSELESKYERLKHIVSDLIKMCTVFIPLKQACWFTSCVIFKVLIYFSIGLDFLKFLHTYFFFHENIVNFEWIHKREPGVLMVFIKSIVFYFYCTTKEIPRCSNGSYCPDKPWIAIPCDHEYALSLSFNRLKSHLLDSIIFTAFILSIFCFIGALTRAYYLLPGQVSLYRQKATIILNSIAQTLGC